MKRTICIFLIAVMLLAAGCTMPGQNTGTGTTPGTTSGTQTAATTAAPTKNEHPGWLSDQIVVVDVMIGNNSNVEQSSSLPGYQKMKELLGVEINFINVPNSDYKQKKATLIATNDVPDIMQIEVEELKNFAREGVFHELTGYIDSMKNFKPLFESIPDIKFQLIDGKLYGLPTISRYEIGRGNILMYRKDLFDKNNIPTPKTWEDYYEALKKLKEIYPDKIGVVNRNGSKTLMTNYGYAMGSGTNLYFDQDVNGGTYLFGPAYEANKDALAFLARLYKEGLLDKDFVSMSSNQWSEKLSNGTGISYYDNPTSAAGNALVALQQIEPDAEWSPMFIPKNADGFSRSHFSRLHPQLGRIWAVGSKVPKKKLDVIMGMFDWTYSDEGADWLNIGEEGVVFERDANGNIKYKEDFVKKYLLPDGSFDEVNFKLDTNGAMAYSSFVPYGDMRGYELMWPQYQLDWYRNFHQKDPAYRLKDGVTFRVMPETPPFTKDEADRIASLTTALTTVSQKMYDNIITGVEGLEKIDEYVETFTKLGYKELEEIYNNARARALK